MRTMNWKKTLGAVSFVAILIAILSMQVKPPESGMMQQVDQQKTPFVLPHLSFSYDGLEPYIDAKTVEIHYTRHHKAYVDNLNKAIQGSEWENLTLPELFKTASTLPPKIIHNAGGHWNHSFYWSILRPALNNAGPSEKMQTELKKAFGSVEEFKNQFRQSGLAVFGSGWTWLVKKPDGTLVIVSTSNQDNPLMDTASVAGLPLLTCDVWEHAYYLKYLNRRDEYMEAFWSIVDWQQVQTLLEKTAERVES